MPRNNPPRAFTLSGVVLSTDGDEFTSINPDFTCRRFCGLAVPMPTLPFVNTVKMFVEVAIVRSAPAAGVPVAIESEPLELTKNVVELPT